MKGVRNSVLFFTSVICFFEVGVASADSWIRSVRAVTHNYEPFILHTIASEDDHLIATATYGDYRDEAESRLPFTIEGIRTKDCRFWPKVTAAVANNAGGPWKNIAYSQRTGEAAMVTLRSHSQNAMLYLDLDPFRNDLTAWKFGRLTLGNGQSAIFETQNASKPPTPVRNQSESQSSRRWSEVLAHREPDPLIKLPFVVIEISSEGDDLQAICSYVDKHSSSPTLLDGVQTSDGKFWPNVVAQVADDYDGVWITIGKCSSAGKPITLSLERDDVKAELYVDLRIFRPMVGKFRYGRLVLINGNVAAFELYKLLPPEERSTSDGK